jgi:hypothetical protein
MPVAEAMEKWEGYGKGSVKKLMTAIKKAREVELARFIYALGIRNVGATTAKDIAKHLKTVDAFFAVLVLRERLRGVGVGIDGIGPVVLQSLDDHFMNQANYDEAFALRDACDIQDVPQAALGGPQPLAGEVLCFTGGLERWSRDQASLIAEDLGAVVTNSAAKKTTILVVGSNVGAKKIEAAEKNGTRCIDEAAFIAIVEAAIEQGYILGRDGLTSRSSPDRRIPGRDRQLMETIEYAGFRYQIVMGLKGQAVMAVPVEGQHKAAGKGKHCRAAVEQFNQMKESA